MVLHPNQLSISLFIIEFPFQIAQFTTSTTRVKIVARAGWATIGSFVDMRCCEAKKLAHQHCVEYVKQMYCKNIYKFVKQKRGIFCICGKLRRCDPLFLSLSRCSIFGHPRGRGCLHLLPWVRSARFHLGSNCIPWQLQLLQLHLIDSSQSELSNLLFKPLLMRFLVLLRYSFSWCDNTTEAGYPGPQNLQVFI